MRKLKLVIDRCGDGSFESLDELVQAKCRFTEVLDLASEAKELFDIASKDVNDDPILREAAKEALELVSGFILQVLRIERELTLLDECSICGCCEGEID